jgi:hypothetical protein
VIEGLSQLFHHFIRNQIPARRCFVHRNLLPESRTKYLRYGSQVDLTTVVRGRVPFHQTSW